MPCNGEDGGFVLLDHLADPPVVFLLEIADGDELGAGSDGELVLVGAPLAADGRPVDTEQNQSGLPRVLGIFCCGPNVGIPVLRAREDAVGLGSPVDARDELVVLF